MGASDLSSIRSRGAGRLARRACAGTVAPSGWILDPGLTVTRGLSDRPGVPTCDFSGTLGRLGH
eukprot:3271520-Alexandrium_andersonii.AAC.1